jgi:hypothetical protein
VQDRGSISNQKSKTLSPTSPKSFRGPQGSIGGQSQIKNQKSKIKNPLDSPPVQDRGSISNQKSKTLSPTSPKSFRGRQDSIGGQSKIKNQKSKIVRSLLR